jgi:exosortase H (IPTLxxWG-CTERM-specific)
MTSKSKGRETEGVRPRSGRGGRGPGTDGRGAFWKNKRLLRTWLLFIATYIALMAVMFLWAAPFVNGAMADWTAKSTAWTLSLLGAQAQAQGSTVVSTHFTFNVITECTAVFPIIIFLAAVLAYPASWKRKLVGAAAGIPLLLLINTVRLVSLFYIGYLYPTFFETAHLLVWQSLMIFFTLLIWLLWAVKASPRHEPGPA